MRYNTGGVRRTVGMIMLVGMVTMTQAQPGGRRGPRVVSPEVQDDGSVLFHLLAPKAPSVELVSPDLGGLPEPGEFTKNDQGIWSLTYGPVNPRITMRYRFNVDGVTIADPSARGTSEANGTVFSLVHVPGLTFQDVQTVAHGAVAEVTYYSKVLQRFRRLHVYTPPGYETSQDTYPVFYLLHGATDSDDSWSTIGRANVILDNLIATGKAVPMIVVMPDGHVTRAGVSNANGGSFVDEFAQDIRPTIEKTYRVHTDRAHRAIAGLSMGGAQTLNIAIKDLADFGYIGVFSSGIFGRNRNGENPGPSWEEQHLTTLRDPALKEGLERFWFATGRDDFLIETSRDTVALFKKHGFDVSFKETDGGHWWRNWRPYLHEFAPLLFQQTAASSKATTTAKTAFSLGADISFVEGRERRYQDKGVEKEICQIMAGHHFNNIRLRIFVNPEAERGYSRQGACGLEATVEMAKRIKAAGMKFTLDFHYSDTWADPDKQFKPSAWDGLTGKDLDNALYEYTKRALTTLKDAGAAPDVVQIGNEINHGMVWPDGKLMDNATEEHWQALMALYKAGQKAVRETLPSAKIMIHLALGGQNTLCREYLDQMVKYDAEFDIVGLSYYEKWHETYEDLKANLYDLAERYNKPLCICEYGANKDNIKVINDIVHSVPNGLGYGTMAWEPTRVLFSREGNASEVFGIYETLYDQYSDPTYTVEVPAPFKRDFRYERPIIGADISWAQSQEDRGTVFSDKGVQKDVLEILKDNKFNWIRLRLFVDPTAEKGYSRQGYCDLEHTLAMAKRIKAAGLKFLLDFHYSDTWADPGKQFKPVSWARSTGSGLEGQVYQYSNDVIKRFIAEGVTPDMVQVGNEIQNGMVWPQGKIEDIDTAESFCVLLRCASAGVRAADPNIKIMVHVACGGQNEESVAFFDKIISRDVKFDVIGQSYYPKYHGTLEELQNNLNDLAVRYQKPIVVVEYQEHKKEVNAIVKKVPNGLGWGTFIWEATSSRWGNLFDRNGATNVNMAIYPALFENYAHSAEEEITVTRDIPYREGDSEAWRLDMAMPVDTGAELRPGLVIVHGGGWRGGSRTVDVFQNMMTEYAQKGYVTINIDYRLTGEAPFPACIEDVKCAVRWLRAHAEQYRVDPERIGAYGHSAGAHLAMMLAMVPKSAGLEGDGGWNEYSSRVNVAAAGSPPTELGRDTPMSKKEWWPIGYISADQPPLFLIQGGDDRIVRPELTEDFVQKMRTVGANLKYFRIDGVGHDVAYSTKLEMTDPAIETFFAKHLKNTVSKAGQTIEMDGLLQSFVDQKKVSCVAGYVAQNGQVKYHSAFGWKDVENQVPAMVDDYYVLFSQTKAITTVAFMTLVEKGLVAVGDPVSTVFPEIPDQVVTAVHEDGTYETRPVASPMTFAHLMSHSSGLNAGLVGQIRRAERQGSDRPAGFGGSIPTQTPHGQHSGGGNPEAQYLEEEMLTLVKYPLGFDPGSEWSYHISTNMLGYLIERISGKPLRQYVKETVLEPIGMDDTDWYYEPEAINRFVKPYRVVDGRLEPASTMYSEGTVSEEQTYCEGAIGLNGPIEDYAKFCQMLLNKGEFNGRRILKPETVELMTTVNQLPEVNAGGEGFQFGLGFELYNDQKKPLPEVSNAAFAWGGLMGTQYIIDPENDMIALFYINMYGAESLYPSFLGTAYQLTKE